MDPGVLVNFVQLQKPTASAGAEGDTVRTWETVRTAWVRVIALTGQEFWLAQSVQAGVDYRVQCRAEDVEDLSTSWRILTEDGRVLHIRAKLVDDKDRAAAWLLCGSTPTDPPL